MIKSYKIAFLLLLGICFKYGYTQITPYHSAVVAFYNFENFYDTAAHAKNDDASFTPMGSRAYTALIFHEKILRLATVLAQIGTTVSPDGPALLGAAEIENSIVLDSLLQHPLIAHRNYKYVHYDSKDVRGLDVALIYNPRYFKVLRSRPLFVPVPKGTKEFIYTRDILWVTGLLNRERVHIFVNHWPSRFGGEKKTAMARMAAARTIRKFIDTLISRDPMVKIMVMGDFNDDPSDSSLISGLNARIDSKNLPMGALYNPWFTLFKRGKGTLAYRNAWSLFDQILLSEGFMDKEQTGFFFYKNTIFNPGYLIENIGPYKGYPLRTYNGDRYRGGYSDHFPVYIVLLKKIQ